MKKIEIINTEKDYIKAVEYINALINEATEKGYLADPNAQNEYTDEIKRIGKIINLYERETKKFDHLKTVHTPPSELLKEMMQERGESQNDLAQKLGISKGYLSELLSGKKEITANISVRLENVWGTPAEFWLKFRMQYELNKARQKPANRTRHLRLAVAINH